MENWTPNHLHIPSSLSEQFILPLLKLNFSLKFNFSVFWLKLILDFSHFPPSSEKQLILFMFFCSSKKVTKNFGGLLFVKYFSNGFKALYSNGLRLIKNSNRFSSPYFSLIGNLGSSCWSLLTSITPECCPKENSKFLEIYSFMSELYSPKGYEKK